MNNIKIFLVLSLISLLFTTSCASFTPASDYGSRSYVPKNRNFFTSTGKLINTSEDKSTSSPIKLNEEVNPTAVLNSVLNETSNTMMSLVIKEAETYIGTPYVYGGSSRNGIDCSAFVKNVFETLDMDLPRVSSAQASQGELVNKNEVREGDLLFFATHGGGRVSHVGIVHGRNQDGEIEFIHASTSKGVTVTPLSDSYWNKRFLYAKRVLH